MHCILFPLIPLKTSPTISNVFTKFSGHFSLFKTFFELVENDKFSSGFQVGYIVSQEGREQMNYYANKAFNFLGYSYSQTD